METRTAVAANPKEMALALVAESAPLMDEAAAAAASSLATAAAGSDAVPEPAAIPTHVVDICPANLLIYTCLAPAGYLRRRAVLGYRSESTEHLRSWLGRRNAGVRGS